MSKDNNDNNNGNAVIGVGAATAVSGANFMLNDNGLNTMKSAVVADYANNGLNAMNGADDVIHIGANSLNFEQAKVTLSSLTFEPSDAAATKLVILPNNKFTFSSIKNNQDLPVTIGSNVPESNTITLAPGESLKLSSIISDANGQISIEPLNTEVAGNAGSDITDAE